MDTNNTVVEADDVRVDVEVVLKKDDNTGKVFSIPSAKDPSANAQVGLSLFFAEEEELLTYFGLQYLVKWQGESYRQLEWIPHAYLVAAYPAKLTNFLARGSTVTFDTMTEDEPEDGEEEKVVVVGSAPLPDPNATERIPLAWSTVDRVLDVFYKAKKGDGMVRFENYRNLPTDPKESIQLVEECYFKWGELPYSACAFFPLSSLLLWMLERVTDAWILCSDYGGAAGGGRGRLPGLRRRVREVPHRLVE